MCRIATAHFAEQATIDRGTQIAVGNHDSHIRSLEERLQAAKEWWDGVAQETGENLARLNSDYAQLGAVPARPDFAKFLAEDIQPVQLVQGSRRYSPNRTTTLQDYLDSEALQRARNVGEKVKESFGKALADMGTRVDKVSADYNELLSAVHQSQSQSFIDESEEPAKLYSEIEAVAKKVDSDLQHVLGLPMNSKSVAQASKMALLHTRNFLPAIKDDSIDMGELVRKSVEQKNLALQNASNSMRSIASIESSITVLSKELENINVPKEGALAFELISLVTRLPYIYGSLLIEAVRRREWAEKMKKDTSTLAEELAVYKEEEERRRKKWLKPIEDVIDSQAVQGNMLGFEINVQPENQAWPTISREELQQYVSQLQQLEGQEADIEALRQAIRDLDRPTKQQVKRAKNFKNGSLHEAAFGRGSQLLLRGDDEARVLREVNAKLEDEVKTSKSRIRRLEDLLHRQSHVHRLSIGGGMPSFGPQSPADPSTPIMEAGSPRLQDEMSRRSSVSSRRFSTNQGQEEKRRILRLEQELAAEKEARTAAEKELQTRSDENAELKKQMDEAVSTKENIMENMKAQQTEFSNERRSLELEIQNYKAKVEEVEDELDRVMGSRDHERTGVQARIHDLVEEVDRLRTDASEQADRAHNRIAALQAEIDKRTESEERHRESLSAAFANLSPGSEAPADVAALISQLEDLSIKSYNHQEELQQAVAMARAENETVRRQTQEHAAELKSQLEAEEARCSALSDALNQEKARSASITKELEEERNHLHALRKKFAEGETGSEALRRRVAEEEARVGQLQIQLAESQSHANSLDVELMHAQKKLKQYEELDASRSHQRSIRAKELSLRLYAQNERLLRLLETLGFVVTYEDGAMVLQRASRMNTSTVMSDGAGLTRSVTTPSPTPLRRQLEEKDLSFLQWSESANPEEEEQRYHDFMDTLSQFNVEAFSEGISKRMRDMEHTARKWQKEARAYRDKSHRLQAEAHDKIAFKSFKEGDLALFLPTRNQATRPWAAFNVGAPHYFLREQESHKLHGREWLVARISKVEERVVDLSKAIDGGAGRTSMDGRSVISNSAASFDDDNPFELSDGLRWYLLDAAEEKPGAPGTPGLGKTTVASARVTGQGQMEQSRKRGTNDPAKTLGKSLDSRRSSGTSSRRSVPFLGNRNSTEGLAPEQPQSQSQNQTQPESGPNSNVATRGASPAGTGSNQLSRGNEVASAAERLLEGKDAGEEVRKDLLWGP
jgi:autophagy-related protein 11